MRVQLLRHRATVVDDTAQSRPTQLGLGHQVEALFQATGAANQYPADLTDLAESERLLAASGVGPFNSTQVGERISLLAEIRATAVAA
jgi:hypothetical protein